MPTMATWNEFEAAVPDFAGRVRERFEAHGLALLATLRSDGSPRISGIEPLVADDRVWLGMMPRSLKSLDLHRDPRLALHSATVDKEVKAGDARIAGQAVAVHAETDVARFRAAFEAATGQAPPPGPFDLWAVDLTEASMVQPAGDHLRIEVWHPGEDVRVIERR
jgi:hypothetical protein